MTNGSMEPLRLHLETTKVGPRVQVGPFGEALSADEARVLSNMLGAVCGSLDNSSTSAAVVVRGAASEIGLLPADPSRHPQWTSIDQRGALARAVGFGTATASTTPRSSAELAEVLMKAWPLGRVLVMIDHSGETPVVDTSWLDESVDPPSELLQRCPCLLVSFFHGDHADIYSERAVPHYLADLIRAAQTGARRAGVTDEPL